MVTVKRTRAFSAWLSSLKDKETCVRLNRRLDRVSRGHFGDVKPIGNGVFEMREHFGPGWRMYYIQRGTTLVVMLGGGDKSTQAADICKAIQYATAIEE
ncbi:addiction module killer protein [Chromatium okenii]|uniref:type II toxin-antitoxin system RelE/ParE family toxin n=1 Tax=Chromatium okenii TaxID=61644 RepID=UPI00190496C7|nr:type II toxin-antitoxin system RelE/ParE family toxin [Chromatium okenii]MBK1642668.1 addiction module killer protein [Chromatium okenii]